MAARGEPGARGGLEEIDGTGRQAEGGRPKGWILRRGDGGGQGVSAAAGRGEIDAAVSAMIAGRQSPLFRLTPEDGALDDRLADAGFVRHDPVVLYAAPASAMRGEASHAAAAYNCAFRLAVMTEIWAAGRISPARLAIMDRVETAKSFLMSRADDRLAGVGFVAVDGDVAMIHAIEVAAPLRRKGAGILLMEAAARFALEHGAAWLALAVTEANAPARALYERLGMSVVGRYHYRALRTGAG